MIRARRGKCEGSRPLSLGVPPSTSVSRLRNLEKTPAQVASLLHLFILAVLAVVLEVGILGWHIPRAPHLVAVAELAVSVPNTTRRMHRHAKSRSGLHSVERVAYVSTAHRKGRGVADERRSTTHCIPQQSTEFARAVYGDTQRMTIGSSCTLYQKGG
eukprot:2731240-Rhodomonas_salina.1